MPLLDVQNLTTHFETRAGLVKAVEGVSFSLERGQTLGIVGESGSGKSVTCYSLIGLLPKPPAKIAAGSAHFDGRDLLKLTERELRALRGQRISMIFQDPMTCLNPYLTVGEQLTEPLKLHQGLRGKKALHLAIEEMERVGIKDASSRIHSYPHEFSGGMRQRVMIAMALITKPEILIADEPTTALDVTVQKQVLDLIKARQKELGTAVILVTHDLGVVAEICDEVNVMYAGRVVERAPASALFAKPHHAYTRALLKSIPANHQRGETLFTIPGLPPNLSQLGDGCAFRHRNTIGQSHLCLSTRSPAFEEIAPQHYVQNCPGCIA